jgi:hypothetical protein
MVQGTATEMARAKAILHDANPARVNEHEGAEINQPIAAAG